MTDPATITSRRHALVEELRTIRDDRDSPFLLLEGARLVQEALHSGQKIDTLVWTPSAGGEPVLKDAGSGCRRTFQVSDSVFKAVSDVESPQGILAVIRRPRWGWKDFFDRTPAPVLVVDGLQNPGNLASIVRTAEAAGAAGLVTTPGTARVFSPKALRGAMGSILRVPILENLNLPEICSQLKKAGYQLIGTTSQPSSPAGAGGGPIVHYAKFDWTQPSAIILGHEGKGLSEEWAEHITTWVHIPMRPPVESLNVAAAAAILLYEANRQRGN